MRKDLQSSLLVTILLIFSLYSSGALLISQSLLYLNGDQKLHFNAKNTSTTRFITLRNRPDLGLNYQSKANTFNPKRKYAVIIVNRPEERETISYLVNLPIACQTWLSIGYGCFVAIINEPKTETDQTTVLQNFIYNALFSKNQIEPSSMILLNLQNHDRSFSNSLSQVSRLFVSEFLKLSMSREEFVVAGDSYLMTSDVDLYPLSTQLYHDVDHDWYLVNPSAYPGEDGHMGKHVKANKDKWAEIIETQDFVWATTEFDSINVFNATGIINFIQNSKSNILADNPKTIKPDWYMDQLVASKLISGYGDKHGWDTVRLRHKLHTPMGRVDRFDLRDNTFDARIEETLKTPFRDSHVCRQIHDNSCFWRLHEMLKSRLSKKDLEDIVDYREIPNSKSSMIQILIENPELGHRREQNTVKIQEAMRIGYKEKHGFDIRQEWSVVYPRTYPKSYKPKYVDWERETVFKNWVETDFEYFVVPTMDKYNLTSLNTFFKCENCTEVQLRK